jgi:hypothetical protein
MKKLLIGVCLALTVAACATPAGVAPHAAAPQTIAGCVPGTIPAPNDCKYFGAVHTQQQMQQSGATNTADALRLLDPSLTVH